MFGPKLTQQIHPATWFTENFKNMIQDHLGQIVLSENDLVSLVMQGRQLHELGPCMVDSTVDLTHVQSELMQLPQLVDYQPSQLTVQQFDHDNQQRWLMPEHYQNLDIAEHVLSLCQDDAELQRCGQELMLFQERGLFDLLKYLKYLVDVMREHGLIWGVGRGSSVASFVLYKLGVHRINSLYYELDPHEFLR